MSFVRTCHSDTHTRCPCAAFTRRPQPRLRLRKFQRTSVHNTRLYATKYTPTSKPLAEEMAYRDTGIAVGSLDYQLSNLSHWRNMFSTRQAAAKLGLAPKTLSRYVASKKVPAPQIMKVGSASLHGWTEEDIERVRALLPKIANGRKTRYQKKRKKQTGRKSKP